MSKAKKLDLGIIIGEEKNSFLSLDEYSEHFLLPYSPRFRSIDFAVSSLRTVGIENIFVFVREDRDIVRDYLYKGWPLLHFNVFDYEEARLHFGEFLAAWTAEEGHSMEHIAIINGSYPVWINMDDFRNKLEETPNITVRSHAEGRVSCPCMIVDKKTFTRRVQNFLFQTGEHSFSIEAVSKEIGSRYVETSGYVRDFQSVAEFVSIHQNLLDDYLMLDHYNAVVPIRGDIAQTFMSVIGRPAHFVNSIFGEDVEVNGNVENSIIFSNVIIDKNAVVKNSIIFPGNHIGSHAHIVNTLIDEFSGDHTLPNIEPHCRIGSERPDVPNRDFPHILSFGYTLIGKDANIPSRFVIGGNCYVDSFVPAGLLRERRQLKDGESVMLPQE